MTALINMLRENPATVSAAVASLALLVSFLSIVLTAVTLYFQRRHNYKSVTPIASFPIGDYEDRITVRLKNTGIGPMVVETFRASDGRDERRDLISWMPDLPQGIDWDTFYGEADGACVPVGSDLVLLQLIGDPNDRRFSTARDNCRRALAKLTLSIVYKDIYQRRMPQAGRSLSWFGRHFGAIARERSQ
jgi:hypothetical protein